MGSVTARRHEPYQAVWVPANWYIWLIILSQCSSSLSQPPQGVLHQGPLPVAHAAVQAAQPHRQLQQMSTARQSNNNGSSSTSSLVSSPHQQANRYQASMVPLQQAPANGPAAAGSRAQQTLAAAAAKAANHSSSSSNSSDSCTCASSGVCPRVEINDIDKLPHGDRYKVLLILTWQALYKVPPDSPLSFYQVSGIHGAPYIPYNNTVSAHSNRSTGYCYHQSTLFPTWHRASVWHFEQIMIATAKAVAQSFVNTTERQAYICTAESLRVPFFDWSNAYLQSAFPLILVNRTALVDDPATPEVALVRIDNPFYEYVVPLPAYSGLPWPVSIPAGQATVRDPANEEDNYVTNQAAFMASMRRNQPAFADQVASFLAADTWGCLYNGGCGLGYTDLETIHNNVHGAVGGTFGLVPTSGFDPMFFMHHAAIDRLFWLWQQRFPKLWVTPRNESGNFYTPGNQTFNSTSELAPFWRSAARFFNSNNVRNISRLGYVYRPPSKNGDPKVQQLLLRRRRGLMALQGQASRWSRYSSSWVQALASYSSQYSAGYRWQLNFQGCHTGQLGEPWYIHVLLKAKYARPKTEHGDAWQQQPGYCGSHYQLAMVGSGLHMAHNSPTTDVTVDVSRCLRQAGVSTDVAPAVPAHPERGPAAQSLPIRLDQFGWVATNRAGHDVSGEFDFGIPWLTWSWLEGGDLAVGTLDTG